MLGRRPTRASFVPSSGKRGHGAAVNTGLAAAEGLYFKVVDSDDWLDENAMRQVMAYLRSQLDRDHATDLVIGNYVTRRCTRARAR